MIKQENDILAILLENAFKSIRKSTLFSYNINQHELSQYLRDSKCKYKTNWDSDQHIIDWQTDRQTDWLKD